ncbi:hypothetical protein PFB07_16490, partial [Paracoccus sp. AS002]|nr:hypothetical protein [Paracoccus sp. AS002]
MFQHHAAMIPAALRAVLHECRIRFPAAVGGRCALPRDRRRAWSLRVQAWAWPDAEALPVPEGGGTAAEILPMLCRAGGPG